MKRFFAWWNFERLVILLVVLNLIDAASTHLLLHLSGDPGLELNPLMRWAYVMHPVVFWVLKMALVSSGLMVIDRLASEKAARAVVLSANALYFLVLGTHVLAWTAN